MKAINGKFINTGEKEKIQHVSREKKQVTYKGSGIRMAWDFSTAALEPKRQ